ncbi:PREDICTED: 5' exonuclease Apollo-like [Priapulus caudatus]|uniref:5' exonuclease Apollo n=1 Tax=Priapulus caudatus TaxID=37621 RepID=A0ABM1F525_PRICU|nr:PREDICTED: 5' exonuclease Apollo-like [Priapulus caudatus]XP_014679546.1 PREDICTED: 5' exonuclease Apollo-like [Priapulus caudatus]XP_014679599.1 PREDICTED: 5' exonuclease Apollo-like [Priapulus caudatus]
MNGHIIPRTPIAVDYWRVNGRQNHYIHFCTHVHSDHISGLNSTWRGKIYTSALNAKLLCHITGVKSSLIVALEDKESYVIPIDDAGLETLTVSVIPANHIQGAVMFLFDGYFGRILYTGDFRYMPGILDDVDLRDIDILYLDNTYCDPACVFPTRQASIEEIIDIIQQHPDHEVVIAVDNVGKEDILVHVANELNEYISIEANHMELLELQQVPDVFTMEPARITARHLSKVTSKMVAALNKVAPTIAILPTARYCGLDSEAYTKNKSMFLVPYSNHSSYAELSEFVSLVRPASIIPVVAPSLSRRMFGMDVNRRADMSCFRKLVRVETRPQVVAATPPSVKRYMKIGACRHTNGQTSAKRARRRTTKVVRRSNAKGVRFVCESIDSVVENGSVDGGDSFRNKVASAAAENHRGDCGNDVRLTSDAQDPSKIVNDRLLPQRLPIDGDGPDFTTAEEEMEVTASHCLGENKSVEVSQSDWDSHVLQVNSNPHARTLSEYFSVENRWRMSARLIQATSAQSTRACDRNCNSYCNLPNGKALEIEREFLRGFNWISIMNEGVLSNK